MADTNFQVQHNEEPLAPPPLGAELASGKWRVRVIDADATITEETISGKQVWAMLNRRVMVDFNKRGQPIKSSGGLFGTWLGSLSNDINILPIDYTDWRKVPNYRKETAWKVIQVLNQGNVSFIEHDKMERDALAISKRDILY